MLELGRRNRLEVIEISDEGVSLATGDDRRLFLPAAELKRKPKLGENLDVFVHYDSEDKLTATTATPLAQVGEFAYLEVASIQPVGAFLNWGLPKELFLPFREQTRELRVGDGVIVFLYLDSSRRISASMRTDKYTERAPGDYREGESVNLLVAGETELGFKAIIEDRQVGILYRNEIFQKLEIGDRLEGYIKKIRPDGKIDLSLHRSGILDASDIGDKILFLLEQRDGYLPLGDKSSPETIYDIFGVSKKKFKMAVGNLYKKKLITIEDSGIRLSPPAPTATPT